MAEYRELLDLSDEEIIFIMKDIFDTPKVDGIERDGQSNTITCNIYIMEEYPDYADEIELTLPGILRNSMETHDFVISPEETLKWEQYLLAKGCDYRLKDNPYIDLGQER